ncbi:hypothetical protein L2E82_35639 [Cichorium intybus]|uniref:Uncharacterized protein n=1 Tax=Cichorium intybus TaxID=13427 RepID=A0ACB9BPM0_CICIN|nr:hypothetical protein L2E82_35639 [Cichorium intybus]
MSPSPTLAPASDHDFMSHVHLCLFITTVHHHCYNKCPLPPLSTPQYDTYNPNIESIYHRKPSVRSKKQV